MRYYVPKLQLGVLSSPQRASLDKFGGLPWGLPSNRWPLCRACGKSMALIAQFFHHEQRLPLGAPERCLFVFMCSNPDSECLDTFDAKDGGNTSFVLETGEMTTGPTYPPDVHDAPSAEIRSVEHCAHTDKWDKARTIWINTEVRVLEWIEQDDGIPDALRGAFTDQTRFWSLPRDFSDKVYRGTKLGSVPAWIQAPEGGTQTFVGQFSSGFGFLPPLPSPDEIGCSVSTGEGPSFRRSEPRHRRIDGPREISEMPENRRKGDETWACGGPIYGGGGMGYLFINSKSAGLPDCEFMWQC